MAKSFWRIRAARHALVGKIGGAAATCINDRNIRREFPYLAGKASAYIVDVGRLFRRADCILPIKTIT